jgi:cysteine synthase A
VTDPLPAPTLSAQLTAPLATPPAAPPAASPATPLAAPPATPLAASPAASPAAPPAAELAQRLRGLTFLIGNTPMLAVDCVFRGERRTVYTKAETLNLTESVKDRMALHEVRRAYQKGVLVPGAWIVEATSGNTGLSFAAIGRALGHPVAVFMPHWMSPERINLIRSLGAQVHLVNVEQGGFLGSIQLAEELAARTPGAFLPRQCSNEDNSEAHELTTGPEIGSQLAQLSLVPNAFVAGVGTGGTVMAWGSRRVPTSWER